VSSAASERRGLVPDAGRRRADDGHASAIHEMFDRIAPTYDRLNHLLSGGLDILWRRRAVDRLAHVGPGAVLDLCAGTMDLSVLVDRARPSERLIAADFCREMLERGRAKVPRAEVVVADALRLPFEDAAMVAVVCGFGVRNVVDPLRAIREVRRVLAPGGSFVTLEFFRPERRVAKGLHRAYASLVLPKVGGAISGDAGAYDYLAKSMRGFLSRAEYEAALAGAGFTRVRSEDLTFGVVSIVTAEVPS
jgi:ubiquinone/menaquinone biosynthesis methyltransferase